MAQRLKRKARTDEDLQLGTSSGVMGVFDDAFKHTFRINDAEFDYIAEFGTDEQLTHLIKDKTVGDDPRPLNFTEKRALLVALNELLTEFEQKDN